MNALRRLKRWWLRRAGQYPAPYTGPLSPPDSMAPDNPRLHEAERVAVQKISDARLLSDVAAEDAARGEFMRITGRVPIAYVDELLNVTTIMDTERQAVRHRSLRYAPRPQEVAW